MTPPAWFIPFARMGDELIAMVPPAKVDYISNGPCVLAVFCPVCGVVRYWRDEHECQKL